MAPFEIFLLNPMRGRFTSRLPPKKILPGQLVVWPGSLSVSTNRGVGLAACADAAKLLPMGCNLVTAPCPRNSVKILSGIRCRSRREEVVAREYEAKER